MRVEILCSRLRPTILGLGPVHCYIVWDIAARLYVIVLKKLGDIKELNIPSIMDQMCQDWSTYTGQRSRIRLTRDYENKIN